MNPGNLKVSQLKALVAVAKCGNFSEAALELDVTQSTISHAIATLETQLGVILLKRGRHGAQLTPVGQQITLQAEAVLRHLALIVQEAEQAKGLQGGTVRIAAFRSVATNILPSAIARLHQQYPSIQVTITELDEVLQFKQSLTQGQIDICLAEILDGDEFESIHIFDDDYIALLPAQAGLRDAQLTLEDLAQFPLIASTHGSCAQRIYHQLQTLEHPLEVAYRIRTDSTIVGMVRQGLGVAIMPRLAAEPIPSDVQVCRLPFYLSRPIGASLLREALHTPCVFAFIDALRETGPFASKAVS